MGLVHQMVVDGVVQGTSDWLLPCGGLRLVTGCPGYYPGSTVAAAVVAVVVAAAAAAAAVVVVVVVVAGPLHRVESPLVMGSVDWLDQAETQYCWRLASCVHQSLVQVKGRCYTGNKE